MKIPSLSKLSRRLLPLVAALALAGCASVSQSLPELPAAPAFKEQGAAPQAGWTQALPAEAQARGQWWLAFADPALDALVDKATLDNQRDRKSTRLNSSHLVISYADFCL